jgi:hypothetical protein
VVLQAVTRFESLKKIHRPSLPTPVSFKNPCIFQAQKNLLKSTNCDKLDSRCSLECEKTQIQSIKI